MAIFNSYVSLPEGNHREIGIDSQNMEIYNQKMWMFIK